MVPIEALIQVAAGVRDTVVMVGPKRGLLEQIASVGSVLMTMAVTAFAVVGLVVTWRFRGAYKKINQLLDRIQKDIEPIAKRVTSISDNVNHITTSVRSDVQQVSDTIASANERIRHATALTEDRLNEFNALLAVVQEEAEQVFVSTAATVRGVRTGAAAFRERSGTDLASDELDPADVADEIESQLESQEVGDGYNGSPESSSEALSAAPRLRPRARGQRRA